MIPLSVISLARSHERRAFMQRQLESLELPFRFFDAIDGSKLVEPVANKVMEASSIGVRLTRGEIGCALSHLAVLEEIAQSQHEYAAVLEDDVFVSAELWRFLDSEYLQSLPPFDVLQLAGNTSDRPRLILSIGNSGGYELCALTKQHYSMFALIYTRDAARRILACISDVTAPIDQMIFNDCHPPGLRVVEIRPSLVRHNDAIASAIGPRLPVEQFFAKLGRETRRCRNWARRWHSFARAWGLFGIICLRVGGGPEMTTGRSRMRTREDAPSLLPRTQYWQTRFT